MPRNPKGAQGHAAQGNRIPVLDYAIDVDRHHAAESPGGVVLTGFKRRRIAAEGDDLRSGQFFHRRVSLDVIKMRMARYDHFDVLDVEPQLLDVRHDDVVHLVGARVVEYVALRSRDQIGAILAAHPVNVADDAEPFGRRRLILSLTGFHASRSAERGHNPDRCTEQHQRNDLTHKTSLNLSWRALIRLCQFAELRPEARALRIARRRGKTLVRAEACVTARSVTWPEFTPPKRFPVCRLRRLARRFAGTARFRPDMQLRSDKVD